MNDSPWRLYVGEASGCQITPIHCTPTPPQVPLDMRVQVQQGDTAAAVSFTRVTLFFLLPSLTRPGTWDMTFPWQFPASEVINWWETEWGLHCLRIRLPMQETWVWSLVYKIPCKRKRQPTPVFLPREIHGQRGLGWVGGDYSPWVAKSWTQLSDWTTKCTEWNPAQTCFLNAPYMSFLNYLSAPTFRGFRCLFKKLENLDLGCLKNRIKKKKWSRPFQKSVHTLDAMFLLSHTWLINLTCPVLAGFEVRHPDECMHLFKVTWSQTKHQGRQPDTREGLSMCTEFKAGTLLL